MFPPLILFTQRKEIMNTKNYEYYFERRRYGTQTYTWAWVEYVGEYLPLGDPYPAINWKKSELEAATLSAITKYLEGKSISYRGLAATIEGIVCTDGIEIAYPPHSETIALEDFEMLREGGLIRIIPDEYLTK
jgi:hypothetical protein